ncbi:holin family protein [Litoreibacter arenae]|uniref:Methionine synthase I, cobalamin-binding domain protein n=1 Tax=Litoreibacter arenae DSM 19593 TaxID=1123360 RepID=S9QC68_9RHOB|nr:holin family protein [Litoreibacter arenae]EPX79006.1 Methionine synthase I, cobalamin-binding domain protein [Litoreibacter arenae DSM 19593]
MGLISTILKGGMGNAAGAVVDVAGAFRPNATRQMELGHEAFTAALDQHGAEFQYGRLGLFDRLMNGLNRLPRPMLALGTLGLFVYAMLDPVAFGSRMQGLAYVPEPLWWLLGAIVSFYFGARELHYVRRPTDMPKPKVMRKTPTTNPALEAWRAERGG